MGFCDEGKSSEFFVGGEMDGTGGRLFHRKKLTEHDGNLLQPEKHEVVVNWNITL